MDNVGSCQRRYICVSDLTNVRPHCGSGCQRSEDSNLSECGTEIVSALV